MTPTEILIQCFKESGPMLLDTLVYESGLSEEVVSASLSRLRNEGRVIEKNGVFKLFNERHSRRVKMGLFVNQIPYLS